MIVEGYSLTNDSTEMVQLSKMKHARLMTVRPMVSGLRSPTRA